MWSRAPVDVLDDAAVLRGDRAQVVQLVEDVTEALGVDQNVERRGLPALVDGDEASAQPPDCNPVLIAEKRQALGLELVQLRQRVELPLVEGEILLECDQLRRYVADLGFERLDSLRDRRDLGAERGLPLARLLELGLHARQLVIDALFAVVKAARRRRGREQNEYEAADDSSSHGPSSRAAETSLPARGAES